jgi:hypothetical protein
VLLQGLCTFHDLHLSAQGSAPSCPFRVEFDDAAGFTRLLRPVGLLYMIFFHAFRRASTHGFRHDLPTSYGAAWPLPRLNFHQRVMPSLARRAAEIFSAIPCWTPRKGHIHLGLSELTEIFSAKHQRILKNLLITEIFSVVFPMHYPFPAPSVLDLRKKVSSSSE